MSGRKRTAMSVKSFPTKIDLGYWIVNIKLVTKGEMRRELDGQIEDDEPTPEGMWDTDTDTIFIGKWLSPKRRRYYLCHELVHAALDLRDSE